MRGVRARWASSVLALVGATSCVALPEVQQGVCGNGVVEPESGEDCDEKDATTCGKASSSAACRYLCDPEAGVACPEGGWKCGLDKICRLPPIPQTWTATLDVPGPGASELLAADLDGDGISDLVSVAAPIMNVTYFEAARTATPGDEILAQSPHPTAGVLADGELPTIALTVSRGLGAFTGTSDRVLFPATYASLSMPMVGGRLQPFFEYAPTTPYLSTNSISFYAYNDQGILAFRTSLALEEGEQFGATQTRVGDGVVARFDAGRLCQQIAMGFNEKGTNRGHAAVFSACDDKGQAKVAMIADVSLPPPLPGESAMSLCTGCQPVHTLDVDGDTRPDLVLVGKNNKVYVAYGDGMGHFAPAPGAPAADVTSSGYTIHPSAAPLAVADFNGDCALDGVLPSGIYVSTGQPQSSCPGGAVVAPGHFSASSSDEPQKWTEARVADLNRDGKPDVVLGSSEKPGIVAYLGTGSPLLNPFEIVTDGPTKALTVGDFDGDLVDDIAFAEPGQPDEDGLASGDAVYVAFGSPGGTPTFAEAVGEVAVVTQILPSHEPAIYPDQIADLFVFAQNKPVAPDSTSMYLFPGNSSRQINAPYFLLDRTAQELEIPRRALIGAFSNDPDHRDVALFVRAPTGESRLWLAPTGDDAYIVPVGTKAAGEPRSTVLPSVLQGADDALLANLGPRQGAAVDDLLIAAKGNGGATLLTTTRVVGDAFEMPAAPIELGDFDIADGNVIAGQMITARVLQKDHPDIVLASPYDGVAIVPWDPATGEIEVGAAWRVGWSELDALGCSSYTIPVKARPKAGVAALLPDDSGVQTLVVVNLNGAYLVRWDGAQISAECALIDGGEAVATGDFDGDGIEDIVVSQRTGLTVYYGDALPPGWVGAVEGDEQ